MVGMLTAGCSSRASHDMISYDSLSAADQSFITAQRLRSPTGGTTTKKKTPRWAYIEGVLVDTNNAVWVWEEAGPITQSVEFK